MVVIWYGHPGGRMGGWDLSTDLSHRALEYRFPTKMLGLFSFMTVLLNLETKTKETKTHFSIQSRDKSTLHYPTHTNTHSLTLTLSLSLTHSLTHTHTHTHLDQTETLSSLLICLSFNMR